MFNQLSHPQGQLQMVWLYPSALQTQVKHQMFYVLVAMQIFKVRLIRTVLEQVARF